MPAELLLSQLQIDRNDAHWKALRREGLGASEMAAVVSLAPESWEVSSPFSLYMAKVEGWDIDPSYRMRRGLYMENWIADEFASEHPELVVRPGGLYRSLDRPWQMATYDRLAFDADTPRPDPEAVSEMIDTALAARPAHAGNVAYTTVAAFALGPVQLKSLGFLDPGDWGEPGSSAIPLHYRCQLLAEMDVGDYDIGWLAVDDGNKVITFVLQRADFTEDIAFLRQAGEEFMQRLRDGNQPEVDWLPATARALKRLHPELTDDEVAIPMGLAARYRRAQAAQNKAAKRKAQAANEILQRMGAARYAIVKGLTDKKGQPVKLATRVKFRQPETVTKAHDVDKLQPGRWTP